MIEEKKDLTGLPIQVLLKKMDQLDHKYSVTCLKCLEMSEDDTGYIPDRIRWHAMTENEAHQIKSVHESENEGHLCEVNLR